MLMRVCQKCGKKIPLGNRCSCSKERHKLYNRYCRNEEAKKFYHSAQWSKLVAQVKARAAGLDELLLEEGKIETGNTVHHIYPIDERPDLRLTFSNLIYLSAKSHNRVHSEYNKNAGSKGDMQKKLLEIVQKRTRGNWVNSLSEEVK